MNYYIELRGSEDGDWYQLIVNGEVFAEGHSIPPRSWLKLLEVFGAETKQTWVPGEDD